MCGFNSFAFICVSNFVSELILICDHVMVGVEGFIKLDVGLWFWAWTFIHVLFNCRRSIKFLKYRGASVIRKSLIRFIILTNRANLILSRRKSDSSIFSTGIILYEISPYRASVIKLLKGFYSELLILKYYRLCLACSSQSY